MNTTARVLCAAPNCQAFPGQGGRYCYLHTPPPGMPFAFTAAEIGATSAVDLARLAVERLTAVERAELLAEFAERP